MTLYTETSGTLTVRVYDDSDDAMINEGAAALVALKAMRESKLVWVCDNSYREDDGCMAFVFLPREVPTDPRSPAEREQDAAAADWNDQVRDMRTCM